MIEIELTKNRAGDRRVAVWEGINSMSLSAGAANIVWIIKQLDSEGLLIEDLNISQNRRVVTPISNANRVTTEGLLISRENYESEEAYLTAFEAGFKEFDFWLTQIGAAPLPQILGAAAIILKNLGRFEKP
jgi:hypothetical protein